MSGVSTLRADAGAGASPPKLEHQADEWPVLHRAHSSRGKHSWRAKAYQSLPHACNAIARKLEVECTALNIAFRRNRRLMLTRGVADKGTLFVHRCLLALPHYDAWNKDNDPHGEADMCTFEVDGLKDWAELDCYDKHYRNFGSEDPAKTLRVATLFFPEEY
jgi:hypothetical protein